MKNACQQISHNGYRVLVRCVIDELSNIAGNIYNKILEEMIDDKEFFEEKLIKNFFTEKKSIYAQVHKVLFDLKNIVRSFLCNITLLTNFQ